MAFVGSYYLYDLKVASLVFALASLFTLLILRYITSKWDKMELVNTVLASLLVLFVYGLNKPELFMLKPTLIGGALAIIFIGSELLGFNILYKLLKDSQNFKVYKTKGLDFLVGSYGLLIAFLNEIARRHLSEVSWVWFKTAVIPLLAIVFMVVFLKKFARLNHE